MSSLHGKRKQTTGQASDADLIGEDIYIYIYILAYVTLLSTVLLSFIVSRLGDSSWIRINHCVKAVLAYNPWPLGNKKAKNTTCMNDDIWTFLFSERRNFFHAPSWLPIIIHTPTFYGYRNRIFKDVKCSRLHFHHFLVWNFVFVWLIQPTWKIEASDATIWGLEKR